MKKIVNVTIKHIIDTDPDTSYIGEYTDNLTTGVIIRALGKFYEKLPAPMERDIDGTFVSKGIPYAGGSEPGTRNYYRYGMQDFKRMEALNRGDFSFIGITAEAEIQTSDAGKYWLCNYISSGGLWGIESDSGEDYFKEVAENELAELEKHLLQLSFTADEIKAAFSQKKTKTGLYR